MNKKTIVLDGRFYSLSTAGIGRYCQNLIANLAKIDQINQYYVLLNKIGRSEWNIKQDNFKPVNCEIEYFSFPEQTKLAGQIKALKPDLIHYLNFNHPILGSGKFIVTVHDLTMHFFSSGRKSRSIVRKLAYKSVMRHAVSASRAIIVPSVASKDDIVKYFRPKPDKIFVTYEAADDFNKGGITDQIQTATKTKFHITKPYFLFVSQWRPHKGLPELIDAFKIITSKYPNYQLVITGKGRIDFSDIIEKVTEAQALYPIITTGFVSDQELGALYQDALALIFPSFYEGFGLPMLEAAQYGCPTIASKTSCMPEIMQDSAEYFKVGDAKDLAQKMEKALTDKGWRSRLGVKARERAKLFSWQKMARETLDIYNKILNNSASKQ